MADPNSSEPGTVVSSTGEAVTALGLIENRSRVLTETAPGSFDVSVGADSVPTFGMPDMPAPLGGLPDASYTFVGEAEDAGGNAYPVFYSSPDDNYFVGGVDNQKYWLYGYSSISDNGDGTYTTVHTDYTAAGTDEGAVTTYSYQATASTACFTPGTRILTPAGERPIEALAVGDLVTTLDGAARPVVWIGRRAYSGRFLNGQRHLLPIRFRPGSLGEGLPRRDLLVSPRHAMFLEGHLVAAELLVNGTTVVRELGCTAVHYLHLELDRHDNLLAEGAPTESFVEDGNRLMFHNGHERPSTWPARYCAPRLQSGYELDRIRRRLAADQVSVPA